MDWQTPEDTVPSAFITEANARSVLGKPAATGAWGSRSSTSGYVTPLPVGLPDADALVNTRPHATELESWRHSPSPTSRNPIVSALRRIFLNKNRSD